MAMSFSRPDPASPAQVADATFSTGRRGFDQNEVRDFLRMVSAELSRLQERQLFLGQLVVRHTFATEREARCEQQRRDDGDSDPAEPRSIPPMCASPVAVHPSMVA